jgi:ComF family protein
VLSLVFPRSCIGCQREDVLLCGQCAQSAGEMQTSVLGGITMRAALPYDGLLRAAIVEFKRGRRAYAGDLAALVTSLLEPGIALVPVPTTRRRIARRGFDQTILLARMLERRCGTEIANILRRPSNAAQHGRSRSERLAASGRFAATARPKAFAGKLVLFDDVRTTGATLLDAARALREGGYDVRDAVTLAWTPSTSPVHVN